MLKLSLGRHVFSTAIWAGCEPAKFLSSLLLRNSKKNFIRMYTMPTMSKKTNPSKDNLGIQNLVVYDMTSILLEEFTTHGWRLDNRYIHSDRCQVNTQNCPQNVLEFKRPLRFFYYPDTSEKFPLKMIRISFPSSKVCGDSEWLTNSQNKWMWYF